MSLSQDCVAELTLSLVT